MFKPVNTYVSIKKPWGTDHKIQFFKAIKENAMLSNNICADFKNAGIYLLNKDKVQPTIENDELLTGIYK